MAESETPPEAKPEQPAKSEEKYKIVEAPIDKATKETLDVVKAYGSKKWKEVMGNFHKPGHRTHNPAKGRAHPRRTRNPF